MKFTAENVMTSSAMAYERAEKQYENLRKLIDTAINNPNNFIATTFEKR